MSTHNISYAQYEHIVKYVLKMNVGDAPNDVPWYLLFDDCGLDVTVDDVIQFAAKYDDGIQEFIDYMKYLPNNKAVFKPNCTLT